MTTKLAFVPVTCDSDLDAAAWVRANLGAPTERLAELLLGQEATVHLPGGGCLGVRLEDEVVVAPLDLPDLDAALDQAADADPGQAVENALAAARTCLQFACQMLEGFCEGEDDCLHGDSSYLGRRELAWLSPGQQELRRAKAAYRALNRR